jgi:hypothetical protein
MTPDSLGFVLKLKNHRSRVNLLQLVVAFRICKDFQCISGTIVLQGAQQCAEIWNTDRLVVRLL